MARGQRPKKGRRVTLLILLAVLCIGGTELLVCRFADPALYDRITAPVRQGAIALVQYVQQTYASAVDHLSQLLSQRKEPEESEAPQYSSDPAILQGLETADPTITELVERNGQELLTGGSHEIVYYGQGDDAWKGRPYGSDTIGPYGCGPTAMSMVVSSLTDTAIDPAEMAQWAVRQGYWARGSGSYLSIVPGTAKYYDLEVSYCQTLTVEQLRLELASGKVAVALMGKGHFTQRGHFIVLRGTTLDGSILVADPASRERSLALWDAQLILDELSSGRAHGAPLWLLRPAPPSYEEGAPAP